MKALTAALENTDLAKQVFADANAAERQRLKDHVDARLEFARQTAQQILATESALKEYGLQTLKWLFLLNAGAIGLVLAYVAGKLNAKPEVVGPILKATVPFALGCVCIVAAGAAAFFNYSYGQGSLPTAYDLHKFLDPSSSKWPAARMQTPDETPQEFYKRFTSMMGVTRNFAIVMTAASALLFIVGIFCILLTV